MSHPSPQAQFKTTTNTLTQRFIFVCISNLLFFLCLNVSYDVVKAADPEASMWRSQQQADWLLSTLAKQHSGVGRDLKSATVSAEDLVTIL